MGDAARWSRADEWRERYRQAAGDAVEHDVRPYFDALGAIAAAGVADLPVAELEARGHAS